eukprot:g762.t1
MFTSVLFLLIAIVTLDVLLILFVDHGETYVTLSTAILVATVLLAEDAFDAMDLLGSTPIFILIVVFAFKGTYDLYDDVRSRWLGVSDDAERLLALYFARQIVHMGMLPIQRTMSRKDTVLLAFHHLVSGAGVAMGLHIGRMHFWGCFSACCEVSTVFLNFFYIMKSRGKAARKSLCWKINGVCLWFAFLLFRMILFPVLLFIMYADSVERPDVALPSVSLAEQIFYPSSILLVFILSVFWFVPLTRGFLKSVGGLSTTKKKKQ